MFTNLQRGVYTLLGDCFPEETLTAAQLRDAKAQLSPTEFADLEHARQQAAHWLFGNAKGSRQERGRQTAKHMKAFFTLYGTAFARQGTPLPAVAYLP